MLLMMLDPGPTNTEADVSKSS